MNQHHLHSNNLFNQQPASQQNLMIAINNMAKCKYFKKRKNKKHIYLLLFQVQN